MTQTQHTNTPYHVKYDKSAKKYLILDNVAKIVCTLYDKETAELITRDHNNYDDMLEALEACDTAFVSWQVGQIPGRPEDILSLITKVRNAIKKAGEV